MDKYSYKKTSRILEFITQIETYKVLFEKLPQTSQIQENLLRHSILKSALFSARIEGNTLDISSVEKGTGEANQKKEVFQILEGLKYTRPYKDEASLKFLCNIHEIVMDGLTSELGRFRSEQSAIFNAAGVAVYLSPPPQKVKPYIDEFLTMFNKSDDLGEIGVLHFMFEKIHPFLDGNGRVGRILVNFQLQKMGFSYGGLISFEEYVEENRDRYYEGLLNKTKDITDFVEFMLEAIAVSAEKVILLLQEKKEDKVEDFLLPRRAEILSIIREHHMISFDQIRRRFLAVNTRTLHFDLQDLIKKGLIKKLGSTRAVLYISSS